MATTKEQKAYDALTGLSGGNALGNVLPKVEQFIFYLGLAVTIIFIISAGYQFFFGESDSAKKNVEEAQKSLTYAVVALVILLLLNLIFRVISNILGFQFDPSSITK